MKRMSGIIDILTINADPGTAANFPYFTSNNAVQKVPALFPLAGDYTLANANAKKKFKNGDSFHILSAGLIIPESFTVWKDPSISIPLIGQLLYITGISTAIYNIDVLGKYSVVFLPMENYEIALDVFVDTQNQVQALHPTVKLNEDFYLTSGLQFLQISMAGAPAALNGKSFILTPFFKILHNYPMF